MKRAIICHGVNYKGYENDAGQEFPGCARHWMPWLQHRYLLNGVNCQNIAFPNSWFPDRNYNDDSIVFSQFNIDEDTRLIGHSCGAGFLLKYLSEHPEIKIRHLVLVAPWIGIADDEIQGLNDYFTDLKLNPGLPERIGKIDLFVSSDDLNAVIKSVEKIKEIYGNKIRYHEFTDKGHFTQKQMGTREFPELWEVCKSQI